MRSKGAVELGHAAEPAGKRDFRNGDPRVAQQAAGVLQSHLADYSNHMFQLTLNQGAPISDPYGWTAGGAAPTGSWFHMVQTNAGMSHLTISGLGKAYVDDLTVRLSLPDSFRVVHGSIFRFR